MPFLLGFDPGRDKCGVAVVESFREQGSSFVDQYQVREQKIFPASTVLAGLGSLYQQFPITMVVMGDGTTTKDWQEKIRSTISAPIVLVDERHSTLEARDRYWQIFPPLGLLKLVPQSLRRIDRPIDDIVAIILLERYLGKSIST